MKVFSLIADINFEAEGIDDAFHKLAEHFIHLYYEEGLPCVGEELNFTGRMDLQIATAVASQPNQLLPE